jgi:type IV secretion system protein VirB3
MAEEVPIIVDPLFLACTRPAMFAGVPMEAFALNGMVTMAIFIATSSFLGLLIAVAIHLLFREMVKHDYNKFRVLMAFFETKARSRNSSYWGGSSCTPLRLVRTYTAKDLT